MTKSPKVHGGTGARDLPTESSAQVRLDVHGTWAVVTLSQPARFNAMSLAMWQQLRGVFERVRADPQLRCVVVRGEAGHFCAGGDIAEYPGFRFDASQLRVFHEETVWGALQAMLDCDVPLLAQIDGNCMGAGLEIASCCDIRICADTARFGAPIARLGFPMAPRELDLVLRAVGSTAMRAVLFEAMVFDAPRMLQLGFLTRCVADAALGDAVQQSVKHIVALAPQAARMNKRVLRCLESGAMSGGDGNADVAAGYDHQALLDALAAQAYSLSLIHI